MTDLLRQWQIPVRQPMLPADPVLVILQTAAMHMITLLILTILTTAVIVLIPITAITTVRMIAVIKIE